MMFIEGDDTSVSLRGLTLTGGSASKHGGGIYSVENFTLESCVVTANQSADGVPWGGVGGGIYSDGTLTLTDCTVSGNQTGDVSNIRK